MHSFWQNPPEHLSLQPQEVHIWQAELQFFPQPTANYMSWPSAEEQQRVSRLVKAEHRHYSAWSYILLRKILSNYCAIPPAQLTFQLNQHGKPYLISEMPFEIFFNLSHSRDCVLFAFTCEGELGIDIEWMNPNISYLELSSRFFTKEEHEYLSQIPVEEQCAIFYKIWTRKEAFIKALGKGLSHQLSSFNVRPDLPGLIDMGEWTLEDVSSFTDFAAAIALPKSPNWQKFFWKLLPLIK